MGENYNYFIQNKKLKSLTVNLQQQFGLMKCKFNQITDTFKFLEESVKIQKESEEVAKRNLVKHIDEKSVKLQVNMNGFREEFMEYLGCVKDIKQNYKKLEEIYLFGRKENQVLAKYFPPEKLFKLAESSKKKKININKIAKKA